MHCTTFIASNSCCNHFSSHATCTAYLFTVPVYVITSIFVLKVYTNVIYFSSSPETTNKIKYMIIMGAFCKAV